jgi:uncharacterized protein YecE (DUF72 family)
MPATRGCNIQSLQTFGRWGRAKGAIESFPAVVALASSRLCGARKFCLPGGLRSAHVARDIGDERPASRAQGASVVMIRVGIGGWVFAPWRGTFYPKGLAQADELTYASRHVTSIEINATFYRTQSATSFRRWRDQAPDDFIFSIKGPRTATHRSVLNDAAPSIERFLSSGILELGHKLGPILWQFPKTMRFNEPSITAFFALLPQRIDQLRLRHVVEVGHESFVTPSFVTLARAHEIAIAFVDSAGHPALCDVTADFVYARLRRSEEAEPTGYPQAALDVWTKRFRAWSKGEEPSDVSRLQPEPGPAPSQRDCFVYFISGAKVRAPAAAMALLQRLGS